MSDKEQNIPNDPDRQLARLIGDALPDLHSIQKSSDPLLKQLLVFKQNLIEEEAHTPIHSDKLWNAIDYSINTTSSHSARILSFTPRIRKYAIAAAILLFAFIGTYFFQNKPSQTLIAESFASIETLSLPDGSQVTLRPHSKLFEIKQKQDQSIYQLSGEGYFEVFKNPNRIFTVKTDQSEVQVLGTKFILSDWGNISKVYLQEGSVQYTNLKNNESVKLTPGQSSYVDEQTIAPTVAESSETEYTDWLNNELVFTNKRVGSIFDELQQHFNIQINATENERSKTLSGAIELSELNSILKYLELVLEGSFTQTAPNTYSFNSESE
ncbi:MAG: FecR family protein [Balneolaceae bacterium]